MSFRDERFFLERLHACQHARAPNGGRWNCGREMSGKFCLNFDFHVTFTDFLHAVKLRHGGDGFASPPKEGLLRNFFRPKNPTASAGCEPANMGTKGQHATSRPPNLGTKGQHATSRPPKPLRSVAKLFRKVMRAVRISSKKLHWPAKMGGRKKYSGNLWPLDLQRRAITCDTGREVP